MEVFGVDQVSKHPCQVHGDIWVVLVQMVIERNLEYGSEYLEKQSQQ
jgi:hypothetical protein